MKDPKHPTNDELPEPDEWGEGEEFISCDRCDGHPACEDFGCAYELGLGNMVRKFDQYGHQF